MQRARWFANAGLLLGILTGVSVGGEGQPPSSPQYYEVKQITFFDQGQKAAFLIGARQQSGQVEHFLIPIYETKEGQFFTYRLVRKEQGNISEIAGTTSSDPSRILALLNNKQIFIFKVTPPSAQPTPLAEVSATERVLQADPGFERVRATAAHVLIQQGSKELIVLDSKEFREVKRLSFASISDFTVEGNRLLVQDLRNFSILDLPGNLINQFQLPTEALRIGAFESGFFIHQAEKTLLVLDRNGMRKGEVKTDQPIRAVAAGKDSIAVISGSQFSLLDMQGRQIAIVEGGPFERLGALPNRFFIQKGQEIWVMDARDGRRLQLITLRNRLEHLVGYGQRIVIVVREIEGEGRLIYAIYDENGQRIMAGFLMRIDGPRP